MGGIMPAWQLQEAKSRFSELVDRALQEGPQMVTRRGREAVVIVSASDYRKLGGRGTGLRELLLNAPRGEPLATERSTEPVRDLLL